VALGKGLFAGPAVTSGLCREFPLGTGCAESNRAGAERSSLSAQVQISVVLVVVVLFLLMQTPSGNLSFYLFPFGAGCGTFLLPFYL
jgi:hypothetical protein